MSPTPDVITKYSGNPIITFKDVPWKCTGAYNPGAVKTPDGRYALMCLAAEYTDPNEDQVNILGVEPAEKARGTILLAFSDDGIHFDIRPEPVITPADDEDDSVYDPRLCVIDGEYWVIYATSTERGIMNGIARSDDLVTWRRVHRTLPDNRNGLLFPERIGGLYARLDRPFGHIFRGKGFDMWTGFSPDGEFWGRHSLILRAEDVPWGHVKVGPSTPPLRMDEGWLVLFHGVEKGEQDRFGWQFKYRTGVMMLDLEDPTKVIGRCEDPIMEPTEEYESLGYRGNVVFPGALVPEDDGTAKIYYGAADQSVCLATCRLQDLIDLCR